MNLNCTVNQVKIKGEIKMTYEYEETTLEVVKQYEPVCKNNGFYRMDSLRNRAINKKTGNFFTICMFSGPDDRPVNLEYYFGFWGGVWLELELYAECSDWNAADSWMRYTGVRKIFGVRWEDGFKNYVALDEIVDDREVFFVELKEALITLNQAYGHSKETVITFENFK